MSNAGSIKRLQDHLKIHMQSRKLTEYEFYPEHEKRTETPEYKKAHEKMTKELDLPCLICGVKYSTLKNKTENPYEAKQMETHHHVIEWALANAIDVDKFNKIILPSLRHKHPDKPEYQKDFTQDDVKNWVDHSEDNLWVLCDVHHRAVYLGIHAITFPIWGPQDLLRGDFEQYAKDEIARLKKEDVESVSKTKPKMKAKTKKGKK